MINKQSGSNSPDKTRIDVNFSYLEQNSVTAADAAQPLFSLPALLSLSPTFPVATPAAVHTPVCQSNSPPIRR